MAGAIAQDRQRCQFPFLVDEKPTFVPGGSAGERSGGARKISFDVRLARSTAVALPSRSASGALATVVRKVDARFIPAGGVPAHKSILTSRLLDHIVYAPRLGEHRNMA